MASFYVENFGCRATQADGASIEQQLLENGHSRAPQAHNADVIVLNTCTVTASADQDARATIRRIHRNNPDCRILVTGCYAQRAPEEIAALPGVTWVLGNSHKHQVADVIDRDLTTGHSGFVPLAAIAKPLPRWDGRDGHPHAVLVGDIFAHTELMAAPVFGSGMERTRPNLKVQDGCNNRCSFCIIPSVRGQSRSLKLGDVLREVDGLVAAGYREVVISGINLGRWGRDFAKPMRFAQLVRAIVNSTALEKLRISSVEPMDWTDEVIGLVTGTSRIAKHAHVPMQSGSDRVLRAMHRKYRPWHYGEKIRRIRAAMPTAAIGADVMVGFPGETDEDFQATRRMVEELPFTYLHVFTYSSRPGTKSAAMPNQVPVQVARERNRVLRELVAQKKRAFQESFIGGEIEAITLSADPTSAKTGQTWGATQFTEALTDNYQKLRLAGRHDANRWVKARVESVANEALVGAISG